MDLGRLFAKFSNAVAKATGSPPAFVICVLVVLVWAVTAGERTYARHHATQAAQTTCTREPTRFFSRYQYSDCLRRSTARTGRRVTA